MSGFRMKTRPTGATATVSQHGAPGITSATGGVLDVTTGASEPGFNPIDLLYASLSACLVLSARIAASKLGVFDRFRTATASVTGEKVGDERSRVARIAVDLEIVGDFDDAMRARIAQLAEEMCTVSNTLLTGAEIIVVPGGKG